MIAVAPVLELVGVEGYTLALAGQLVVITASPCPVASRTAFGAHTVLPVD